jgi:hypothetical protein
MNWNFLHSGRSLQVAAVSTASGFSFHVLEADKVLLRDVAEIRHSEAFRGDKFNETAATIIYSITNGRLALPPAAPGVGW